MKAKSTSAFLRTLVAFLLVIMCVFTPSVASARQFEFAVPQDDITPQSDAAPTQELTPQDTNIPSTDRDSTNISWGSAGDYSQTFVFDLAGLFTPEQQTILREKAQALADEYQMGVYLLTTDYMNGLANPTSSQRTSYATGFYKQYGLGLGAGHDGIMLVVAATSRDYVTIAYGQGSYSFDDSGIQKMEDAVTDCLSENEWYNGAQAYYDQIGGQLAYYAKHGRPGAPLSLGEWIFRIAIIVVVALIVGVSAVLAQRATMKPVRLRTEANEYIDPSSVVVVAATDTFITTDLAVVALASSSSSGGGGGWGGGGGGGFSSSGGGKF